MLIIKTRNTNYLQEYRHENIKYYLYRRNARTD